MSLTPTAASFVKLGLHLMDRGQFQPAVWRFGQALEHAPRNPDILYLMGLACYRFGAFERAEQLTTVAASIKRSDPDILNTLGLAKRKLGKIEEAIKCFEAALRLDPAAAEARVNLAISLPPQRHTDSRNLLRRALVLMPVIADGLAGWALEGMTQGDRDAAIRWHRRAASVEPDEARRWEALGSVLLGGSAMNHAEPALRRAAVLAPDVVEPLNGLGFLALSRLELSAADRLFQRTLAGRPDFAYAHRGRAEVAFIAGETERAIEFGEQALSHAPGDMALRYRFSLYLLAGGRLERGWHLHDCLWSMPEGIRRDGLDPAQRWHEGSFYGGRLLVLAEQGVGDEVLFLSCLPELVDAVNDRHGDLIVECDPRLVAPLTRCWPTALVHAFDRRFENGRAVHRYDWIPDDRQPDRWLDGNGLMPRFRRCIDACDAADRQWLAPDPPRVVTMRERLSALGGGLKVGVSWRSRTLKGFRGIHYPGLAAMAALLSVEGVHFVSLQYGDGWRDELAAAEAPVTIIEDLDTTQDIDGVLALIAALDLVICPSSTLVWLAASIGAPVWIPHNAPTYLELGTDRFPGFPTIRGFAKKQTDPWAPALGRVAAALAAHADQVSDAG